LTLLPNIDAQTMEIHHDKHHQGYVNKLNVIEGTDLADKSIEEICKLLMSKSTVYATTAVDTSTTLCFVNH
jgi:Fe-Mn family superoxide dismutase